MPTSTRKAAKGLSAMTVHARPDYSSLPATGAWRAGDHPGRRRFASLGPLRLENGAFLPEVCLAYETWGKLNATGSNAVLVLHALTGDSHVTGEAEPGHPTPGWWGDIVGPGKAIDTDRYYVVAPNVLGGCQGSTGASSLARDGKPYGSRFPQLSTRDQVRAEIRLADFLGVEAWSLVIGGSMGGHRALEWAVTVPERVGQLVAVATTAQTTAEQTAWAHPQLAAIELDPFWHGGDYYDGGVGQGPARGLGVARQIAHTTYRSRPELDSRFGRLAQHAEDPLAGGRFAVQSYLDYQAFKLARRFDAGSYVTMTRAMLSHDVGRNRGGVAAALNAVTARTLVVVVDSDRLFYPEQGAEIAAGIAGARFEVLSSRNGHDGFLTEHAHLADILQDFLLW